MKSPHIRTTLNELGQALVRVEDDELFDFVEDYLVEEHDLDYMFVQAHSKPGCPTWHTMTFDGGLMAQIQAALSLLDAKRLHDIFLLNNPAPRA